jgi:16S rRNA (adenine1518-N6/adenine1519-N6)-dimethyltransferase
VQDEKLLVTVVRAAFNQRRKTLVNALASGIGWLDKEAAERAISSCGLDVRVRGEALSIEAFARLSDVLSDLRER